MKKLVVYFFIVHTVVFFITGFGLWFILNKYFPELIIERYYIIPLFFYLMGIIFVLLFRRTPVNKPKKMVNLYMLMRMVKIFLSVSIILIYWLIDKHTIRKFAIIFAIFYLINLIWETYIYFRMELYFKYKSEHLNHSRNHISH